MLEAIATVALIVAFVVIIMWRVFVQGRTWP